MDQQLPRHDIVLLGVGHTNAHVLKMWRMNPLPEARLTCISNFRMATYSGMLPGFLAGQYHQDEWQIDLVRLTSSAGARLIVSDVVGLDRQSRCVIFADRPPLPFDVLSIGTGSVPDPSGISGNDRAVRIKPMQTFSRRLLAKLRGVPSGSAAVRVVVVGGGVGGVEIALCLPKFLGQALGARAFTIRLVHGSTQLMPGTSARTRKLVRDELRRRDVDLELDTRVANISDASVFLSSGLERAADIVIWATGARGPAWLGELGLATDSNGFLLTRETLQTLSDDRIFAVGDAGTIEHSKIHKAGVFAVRQGPILWDNVRRVLRRESLRSYVPQRTFLKLINLGDGRAIAEYHGVSFRGRWCWRLKDRIDRRFMQMYQDYTPMSPPSAAPASSPRVMRCAGCGGKVGGAVLSRVLDRLEIPANEHVLLGLDRPDDAAIVRAPEGKPLTVTTDFFAAPLDDPYLVGRIAALNALSDAYALGSKPFAALAIATIPPGAPRNQEQLLYELLAGSLHEFRRAGTTLAGGHTTEGAQLILGYTILAGQGGHEATTKGDLQAGDHLILTKPLGSGVLLAGHMQAKCRAPWMKGLLRVMLQSNQPAASVCEELGIRAVTDITGFGLAGHLLEMLTASRLTAELNLQAIPLLEGAAELTAAGVESTLAPANRMVEARMRLTPADHRHATYPLLFDPQTSGGLLLGVPERLVAEVLTRLGQIDDCEPRDVGIVRPNEAGDESFILPMQQGLRAPSVPDPLTVKNVP